MPGLLSFIPRRANALRRVDDSLVGPVSAFESETQAVIHETTPYSEHAILHGVAIMIAAALVLVSVVKLDRVVSATRASGADRGLAVRATARSLDRPRNQGQRRRSGQERPGACDARSDLRRSGPYPAAAKDGEQRGARRSARGRARGQDLRRGRKSGSQLPIASDALATAAERIPVRHSPTSTRASAQPKPKLPWRRPMSTITKSGGSLANKIEAMDATLEQHGTGSKLKTLVSTDNRVDFDRLLAESQSQLDQSTHDLDSLKAQREVFIVNWQEDIGTQLVAARDDLDVARQGLSKAERVSQLINLAGAGGRGGSSDRQGSVGSVVDPTTGLDVQPLFTLIPLGGPLEADVEIDSQDIGFIKVGDPVEIKLDAYPFMRHGTAQGKIKTISEGSFTQGEGPEVASTQGEGQGVRSPYFKARIVIEDVHLKDVPATFRLDSRHDAGR